MGDWTKNQIVKADFDHNKFDNITIRIKTNGFVVYGINQSSAIFFIDEYQFIRGYNFEIINEVVEKEYHTLMDDKVQVKMIYPARYFSIVPSTYFSESDISAYFLHAIPQSEKDFFDYNYDKTSTEEIICVNAFNKGYLEHIKRAFPNYTLIAESKLFMNVCTENYKQNIANRPNTLFLHFFDDKVDDLLFVDDKLLLMNRIEYHTVENFIYHILNVSSQFNMPTNKIDVILLGDIQKQSTIVSTLAKYFDRIQFMTSGKIDITSETPHAYNLEINA